MRGGPAAWGDLAAGGGGPGPCRGGRRGGTLPPGPPGRDLATVFGK